MSKIIDFLKASLFILIFLQISPKLLFSIKNQWLYSLEQRNQIGYLIIDKNISNSSPYRKSLTEFFKNPAIKAVLIKIECSDGAIGSCQALAYDIESLKKEFPKPIIAYTENICTAGGYQIATAADYIVATGSALIGGVGSQIPDQYNVQDFLKQYHVDYQEIKSGSLQGALHQLTPLTTDQQAMLQQICDNRYQQFAKEVAGRRHLQMNKIDQWGQGRIFTGLQAYDLKLIDIIGSKRTAINLIKKNIIPCERTIEWVIDHPNDRFFSWLTTSKMYTQDDDLDEIITKSSLFESFFTALFAKIRS